MSAQGLEVLAYTFATVFLAELGDKTQLAILALSLRGQRARVLAGAALAFSLVNGLSSAVGYAAHMFIPLWAIRLASAIAFLAVGALGLALGLLRRAEQEEGDKLEEAPSVLRSFVLVALAELGDKTQLATVGFSALTGLAALVALGAVLALMSMAALTCAIGGELAKRLHGRKAELLAYTIFLAVGLAMLLWPWLE